MGLLGTFDNFLSFFSLERFQHEVVCQKRQQNNNEYEGALADCGARPYWSLLLAWILRRASQQRNAMGGRSGLSGHSLLSADTGLKRFGACPHWFLLTIRQVWRNGQEEFEIVKKVWKFKAFSSSRGRNRKAKVNSRCEAMLELLRSCSKLVKSKIQYYHYIGPFWV